MRVSRSGAVRSAMRPHSNRLRSRSSRVVICLRRSVGRQHDLLALVVDGVEGVEELLLGPLLVGDELDVVDEQQVDPPVARPEVVDPALLDAGDELVGELLAGDVDDALAREARDDRVADGVHQVRLAQADAAVQEERVVGVARALGDRQARGMGEAVGRADDEVAERVARVEADRPALRAADPARLEAHLRAGAALALRRGWRRLGSVSTRSDGDDLADLELDVHAVADHARQRLADQRPVAGLQPVLGEAVGDGDAEAAVVDGDERGVLEPGLEVGGRKGDLQLTEGGAPDLLRIHR